jgi:adenosine deaminase
MSEEKKRRHESPEDIAEILSVVSDKVPSLIKGLVGAVFSEESARNMAKAAATYYKELKAGGFPDDVALKMTQDYVSVFTKIGDVVKAARESHGGDED